MTTLTAANAKTASTIQNVKNPEWGTFRFNYNENGFHSYGSGANSAVLFESDFSEWTIITVIN
jgi:hypothetical protein